MSKKDIVQVKTVGISDFFEKGKNGICGICVRNEDVKELVEGLKKEGYAESYFIKYESEVLDKYVGCNYENMSNAEIKELEEKHNVTITYYHCEDK